MGKKKISYIFIGLMILVAIGLRALFLDSSLWYDEACSWAAAKLSFGGILDYLYNFDFQHTPLYFFVLHVWMKIFGDSEIALKSLSLLFSIASLPLVYIITNKLSNKTNAFLATSVVAFSPLLIYFSTEVRMYPMVIFLVLLSLNYLIDFEKEKSISSAIKLVITNILIPYTFIGALYYNVVLYFSYMIYLYVNKRKDDSKTYGFFAGIEFASLIPLFFVMFHYAGMRDLFLVKHEGSFFFSNVVDVIRNFFATSYVPNVYWPSDNSYVLTFTFFLLIAVPCYYFIRGLVEGFRKSKDFEKLCYTMLFVMFGLFIIFAIPQVYVFTSRYMLYLLPLFFIFSIIGLSKVISPKHLKVFVTFFCLASVIFVCQDFSQAKDNKYAAFEAARDQLVEYGLDSQDMVILPIGADAPYYFRTEGSPQVLNFDFHKEVRNPKNSKYYDESQQKDLVGESRYKLIYDVLYNNRIFSEAHYKYFQENVINKIPSGHYVAIALYGSDANALLEIEDIRKNVTGLDSVRDYTLELMLQKYLFDVRLMLKEYFTFNGIETKGVYTYLLYQKK